MSLEKLVKEKLRRLNTVPDAFASKVDDHQKKIYTEILKLLDSLERKDGVIVLNESNIAKVQTIINQVKETFFNKEYLTALKDFAGEFDTQAKITNDLFKAGFGELPNEAIFKQVLQATKRSAVDLFGESVMDQTFFQPLREQILNAVTNGATFPETIDAIRLITIGDDKAEGLLQSHAKTYARTSFSVADRNYTTTIAESFSIEWYEYAGSEIETTRPFCESRHGKYYPKKEIESWGSLEPWSGYMKGTNPKTIFTNLGGWNCRHSLIAVSVFSVPKPRVREAMANGYYEPDKTVREWLEKN